MIVIFGYSIEILANLDLKFNKTSKYNPKSHILFMDLHNLMVLNNYDHEKQMSIILINIYFSVVTISSFILTLNVVQKMFTINIQ
jgi:hypothetical protein